MALTANRVVKRQGRDGKLRVAGVAASVHIYEGALIYEAAGLATPVAADQNATFLGVARREADNSSGSGGDINVEFWSDGTFELPFTGTGLAAGDIGATAYGLDDEELSEAASGNPAVGTIVEIVANNLALVETKGLGEGLIAAGTA